MLKPTANQKRLLKEYKQTISLSKNLFDIGVGTLLGDASIQTQDRGKTYRLKFQQSNHLHGDYLYHIYQQFDEWVLSPPNLNQQRNMLSFQTISHCDFKQLAELFVLDSQKNLCKKHIKPHLVEHYVTPRALAYWFMDDGGRSCYNQDYPRKGFALNTHGFPKEQVELLCQGLETRYDLTCWPKANKNKWIIVISGNDHEKMLDLILDFVITSMRYKIPGFEKES